MVMIVAIDENNTIAIKGEGIPWDIEEDFNQYLEKTRDKPLIMGRKTYEATRQPMPKTSIVMTRDESYTVDNDNINVVHSKEEAEEILETIDEPIYNIGGSQVYSMFFEETNKLIVSHIDGEYKAENPENEIKFPEISLEEWEIENVELYDQFQLITYNRK